MIDKNKLAIYPEWEGPIIIEHYDIYTNRTISRIDYRKATQRVGIDLSAKEFSNLDYYGINLALLTALNGKPIKYSTSTRLGWKWRSFKRLFNLRRYAKIF